MRVKAMILKIDAAIAAMVGLEPLCSLLVHDARAVDARRIPPVEPTQKSPYRD